MTAANRLAGLRRRLAGEGVDAIIVSQPENRRYLSGFDGSAGLLLITGDKACLATDFRYYEQVTLQAPDYELVPDKDGLAAWLPPLLDGLKVTGLGFESSGVTYKTHRQLQSALRKCQTPPRLKAVDGLVESLREIKEPGEIALIEQAARIADAAYEAVAATIKAGMTELEVAWELEKRLRQGGSQAMPFEVMVAAGPNASRPHALPSARPIREGEPVLIDMGAKVEGYASDLSRTVCAGPPDETFRRVYRTVLDAQQAAMAIIREGITGEAADAAAREVIAGAGYGEAFGHALGHGVGLATHEQPRLGPGSAAKLAPGMVFTVEPGIYLPGWGGVRIEDTVTIRNDMAEAMTRARKGSYD